MDLNNAITNDVITVSGTLTYGGTLALSGVSDTLTASDQFQLFLAGGYNGSFSSITPESPGPGLAWNTSTLAVDGTLRIDAIAPPEPPTITGVRLSNGTIELSGSNGMSGGSYYVLTSTNLALPLSNWTRMLTNLFDENGSFGITNAVDPTAPREFYLLQLP
jgi:hypothetical protein